MSSLYEPVVKAIKDLGFPVAVSIALLYNGWSTQTYLMTTGVRRDEQLSLLASSIQQLARAVETNNTITNDNNRMLRDITAIRNFSKNKEVE